MFGRDISDPVLAALAVLTVAVAILAQAVQLMKFEVDSEDAAFIRSHAHRR